MADGEPLLELHDFTSDERFLLSGDGVAPVWSPEAAHLVAVEPVMGSTCAYYVLDRATRETQMLGTMDCHDVIYRRAAWNPSRPHQIPSNTRLAHRQTAK